MSIQDDYNDIKSALKSRWKVSRTFFKLFIIWAFKLEKTCNLLAQKLQNAKITIKAMMKEKNIEKQLFPKPQEPKIDKMITNDKFCNQCRWIEKDGVILHVT